MSPTPQPVYDCHNCKQPGTEFFYDKRYKHSLCRGCFLERRQQAANALDTDWFLANVPFDQLTEHEKNRTGIASLDEYNKAKWDTEHPDLDGADSTGSSDLREERGPRQH